MNASLKWAHCIHSLNVDLTIAIVTLEESKVLRSFNKFKKYMVLLFSLKSWNLQWKNTIKYEIEKVNFKWLKFLYNFKIGVNRLKLF